MTNRRRRLTGCSSFRDYDHRVWVAMGCPSYGAVPVAALTGVMHVPQRPTKPSGNRTFLRLVRAEGNALRAPRNRRVPPAFDLRVVIFPGLWREFSSPAASASCDNCQYTRGACAKPWMACPAQGRNRGGDRRRCLERPARLARGGVRAARVGCNAGNGLETSP